MFQIYDLARKAGWDYVDCSIELTERGLEVEVSMAPHASDYEDYLVVTRLLDWSFGYNENIFQEIACELRNMLIDLGYLSPGKGGL